MSDIVIKVENLSKQYRLGSVGTGTLGHDLNRWWHTVRGKEDPYLMIGEANDRAVKGSSEYVWALQDINFEVKQGEVLGIIGRNGAGKSTLLKILSRTTLPTTGSVKLKGRIASLLEVGTGFHPELSGRENIFLNGAILGMTKQEIKSKFDEIVDFAGVERYIDTPVKRYSSGMYVRLAFGVAAHLEPEILIVDEVLAVGDAEFQKKALGKMKDVSMNDGRTVLFVSHNMAAMRRLCNYGLYLSNGEFKYLGEIDDAISRYLDVKSEPIYTTQSRDISITSLLFFDEVGEEITSFATYDNIVIQLTLEVSASYQDVSFALGFDNMSETRVTSLWSSYSGTFFSLENGRMTICFIVKRIKLLPGEYNMHIYAESRGTELLRIDKYKSVSVSFLESHGIVVEPKASQGFYLEEFSTNLKIMQDV